MRLCSFPATSAAGPHGALGLPAHPRHGVDEQSRRFEITITDVLEKSNILIL